MGYPMTYQRVINRNNLLRDRCGYDQEPPWHTTLLNLNIVNEGGNVGDGAKLDVVRDHWVPAIEAVHMRLRMLAGDLRRLEDNTTDENAVCKDIAQRTGVDPEDVAVVLKAWMEV